MINKNLSDNSMMMILLENRLTHLEKMIKEDMENDFNANEICIEILDEFDSPNYINEDDIIDFMDEYYPDLTDEERLAVVARMHSMVEVD